jgi:hypothetical protein
MNKLGLILAMSLASGGAYAQGTAGVTTSTDPAKAAAVERHAQELQANQSKEAPSKPAASHTSSHKPKGKTSAKHKSSKHDTATAGKS